MPPPLPDHWIRRGRLDRLLSGDARVRLTVVTAPAGAGKSTLLARWGQMRPAGELAWLTLEEHDDDPDRFWCLVSAALRATSPTRGVEHVDFDLYSLEGLEPVDLVLSHLECRQPCSLVIDNFHLITDTAIIDSVARFVERLPVGVHVILAGQHIPSPQIARFLHKDATSAIGASDLAFTVEDCGGLMALSAGKLLSIDELTALTERSEGWAAGLYLAANAIRTSEDTEGFVRHYSGAYGPVAAYLEHEVLQRQPTDVIRFLLQTSILDRLQPELCCAVADRHDAGQLLAAMADRNMFVVRQEDPTGSYRYHRLLRDLLRSRLQLEDSEVVAVSHRRAAEWYRQAGTLDEAAFHFAEAGAYEEGFGVLFHRLLGEGALSTSITRQTSEGFDSDVSHLYVRAAASLASGRVAQATHLLRMLDASAADDHDRRRWSRRVEYLWAVHAQRLGDPDGVLLHSRSVPAEDQSSRIQEWGPWQALDLAIELTSPLMATRASLIAGRQVPQHEAIDRAALEDAHAAVAATWACNEGRLVDACRLANTALQNARTQGSQRFEDSLDQLQAHLVLGEVFFENNQLSKAEDQLLRALELACCWEGTYWLWAVEVRLIEVLLAQRRLSEALDRIDRLRRRQTTNPPPDIWQKSLNHVEIRARIALDDLDGAHRIARATAGLSDPPGVLARFELYRDQSDLALAELNAMQSVTHGAEIRRLVLLTRINAGRGKRAEACLSIKRAVEIGRPGGYVRPFLEGGRALLPFLRSASAAHGDSYLSHLVAEAEQIPSSVPANSPDRASSLFREQLTAREKEVLRKLASHHTQPQIARSLYVSLSTVKTHTKAIYRKIGATSRADAVEIGRANGLL